MVGSLWFATVTSFLAGLLTLVQHLIIFPPAISKASRLAILPLPTASQSLRPSVPGYQGICPKYVFKLAMSSHHGLRDKIDFSADVQDPPWPPTCSHCSLTLPLATRGTWAPTTLEAFEFLDHFSHHQLTAFSKLKGWFYGYQARSTLFHLILNSSVTFPSNLVTI